jgi:hypothetical protein
MEKDLKNNSKSILIDSDLHHKFKLFCKGKNLKLGAVIEDLIRLYLYTPKEIQKLIDDVKDKYLKNN